MYQQRMRTLGGVLLMQVLWLTLLLMACRGWMQAEFVSPAQLAGREADLGRMWQTGLRYDLRVAGLSSLPLLLAGLLLALSERSWAGFVRALPWLVGVVGFATALLAIGNVYYYQTYHTHFDVFIFGLVDDDTRATLANIWQDYPVLRMTLLVLVLAAVPGSLARWLLRRKAAVPAWRTPVFVAYLLCCLLALAVTSTQAMQRKLGRRWQLLHNFVYLVAILAPIHYLWSVKIVSPQPVIYALLAAGLLTWRYKKFRQWWRAIR